MNIKPFKVEEWMNEYEDGAKYNIAETCVDSVSLDELFTLTATDKQAFLNDFCQKRLTYGYIWGLPKFKSGICSLYKTLTPDQVVLTHGAAGANHHVFYSLIQPGDRVISVMPTYQQLYAIPESYGATVVPLHLRQENGYLPDLDELRTLCTPGTRMICLNNPNNPTGALMTGETLKEIVMIARKAGAFILCDEVYRHLTQDNEWSESIVDLYERGISVSSMSKVFSLAGLRLGWIATHDQEAIESLLSHRDYNLISCGMFDEQIAGLALENAAVLLERNRQIVRTNLAILDAWVQKNPHVHYTKPQAGTTALIYYDLPIPSRVFCEEMYRQTGAFVTPGECFEEEKCFRIGYACDAQTLKDGLDAMESYLKSKE